MVLHVLLKTIHAIIIQGRNIDMPPMTSNQLGHVNDWEKIK